jgi:hypothetical protein
MSENKCENCKKINVLQCVPDMKIDRTALDFVETIGKHIEVFRGFRKMWADTLAASSVYYGVPHEILLDAQKQELMWVVYHSLQLHNYCWNNDKVPHAHYSKDNAKTAYQDEVELKFDYAIAIEDAIALMEKGKTQDALKLLKEVIKDD